MSRLLKLISCTAALTAGAGVALAIAAPGSAPARGGSHLIICPLEPGATVPPCCGPPVAASTAMILCCGTPEPINCPVALTVSSSPDPSVAGQKLTLTGRWPGGTAGQSVELWQELPGATSFKDVAQTKTASFGSFQFVRRGVETNRQWYVTVGSERSVTIDQGVKAKVTVGAFGGRVTPNHAGERVLVQRHTGGGWVVIARPRLSKFSTYSIAGRAGELRAVFPGDKRNVRSVSRVRQIAH